VSQLLPKARSRPSPPLRPLRPLVQSRVQLKSPGDYSQPIPVRVLLRLLHVYSYPDGVLPFQGNGPQVPAASGEGGGGVRGDGLKSKGVILQQHNKFPSTTVRRTEVGNSGNVVEENREPWWRKGEMGFSRDGGKDGIQPWWGHVVLQNALLHFASLNFLVTYLHA